jgi:hypothetical protein
LNDSLMTEESIVSKVAELMEALDNVKKYNALARSLKKFVLAILGSIMLFLTLSAIVEALRSSFALDRDVSFLLIFLLLLIPLIGTVGGILFVRYKVNSVPTGKWRQELTYGFPSALKILTELDWEGILDEISIVKLSYIIYGFIKTVAYGALILFGFELLGNALIITLFGSTSLSIVLLIGFFSLFILFIVVGKDLLRRYKEIEALNMLLLELRWFSLELRRVDIQT